MFRSGDRRARTRRPRPPSRTGSPSRAATLAALALVLALAGATGAARAARAAQTGTAGTAPAGAATAPTDSLALAAGASPADTAAAAPRSGWLALPGLFYTPETKTGAGAFLLRTFRPAGGRPDARPSSVGLAVIGTQRSQWIVSLAPDFYWRGEDWRLSGAAGWMRYPTKFYGIGPGALETAEEDYTPRSWSAALNLQRRLKPWLKVGVGAEFLDGELVETEAGRSLAGGAGADGGSTVPGAGGGRLVGVGVTIASDTRDSVFWPLRGREWTLAWTSFGPALGSDYVTNRWLLNLKQYVPAGKGQLVAVQGLLQAMTGQPPFYQLAALGGQNLLRGYYEGRWRDRCLAAVQVDYRRRLGERWGVTLFGAAGTVARDLDRLAVAQAKLAGGAGVRFALNKDERIYLRFDYGVGDGSSGSYITVNEAF